MTTELLALIDRRIAELKARLDERQALRNTLSAQQAVIPVPTQSGSVTLAVGPWSLTSVGRRELLSTANDKTAANETLPSASSADGSTTAASA